jgi:hypothetical protein
LVITASARRLGALVEGIPIAVLNPVHGSELLHLTGIKRNQS